MVVYPRWRGELFCALAFCWLSRGLSPLARGTLCRCQHCWRVIRFIPAGAGNTVPRIISLSSSTVYPRWRGEHVGRESFDCPYIGLSPLARGTLAKQTSGYAWCRFIPAGAGNTNMGSAVNEIKTVYPRWRGEHEAISKTPAIAAGLSPLARGTPGVERQMTEKERFIPAGAGNTSPLLTPGKSAAVYPRWRGEHPFIFVSSWRDLGLSPLARGTRTKYPSLNPRRRFIPAGAGNTIETFHAIKQAAVYPRWRGEH